MLSVIAARQETTPGGGAREGKDHGPAAVGSAQTGGQQPEEADTRLASAPVPFTVLLLVSNLCNENFLVVCGLKVIRE